MPVFAVTTERAPTGMKAGRFANSRSGRNMRNTPTSLSNEESSSWVDRSAVAATKKSH